MLNFCNSFERNKIFIISNSDIYFPIWNINQLKKVQFLNMFKTYLVLTRYNIYDQLLDKIKAIQSGVMIKYGNIRYQTQHRNGCSIDSWIFKTPINLSRANFDIEIGRPGCDGHMNYQLSKIGRVYNPCLSIISIHNHKNWDGSTTYKNINYHGKNFSKKEWKDFMLSKGFKLASIKFCKLSNLPHKYKKKY